MITKVADALQTEKQKRLDGMKEYREANKEKICINVKKYKEKNADKVKAQKKSPVYCGCGSIVRNDNYARHCQTNKKHSKWLAEQDTSDVEV